MPHFQDGRPENTHFAKMPNNVIKSEQKARLQRQTRPLIICLGTWEIRFWQLEMYTSTHLGVKSKMAAKFTLFNINQHIFSPCMHILNHEPLKLTSFFSIFSALSDDVCFKVQIHWKNGSKCRFQDGRPENAHFPEMQNNVIKSGQNGIERQTIHLLICFGHGEFDSGSYKCLSVPIKGQHLRWSPKLTFIDKI